MLTIIALFISGIVMLSHPEPSVLTFSTISFGILLFGGVFILIYSCLMVENQISKSSILALLFLPLHAFFVIPLIVYVLISVDKRYKLLVLEYLTFYYSGLCHVFHGINDNDKAVEVFYTYLTNKTSDIEGFYFGSPLYSINQWKRVILFNRIIRETKAIINFEK